MRMVKRAISTKGTRLTLGALACLSLISLTTCEGPLFGLGVQVDMGAPTIEITSPSRDAYLAGDFVIEGNASDDLDIESVVIRLKDKAGGLLKTYEAEYSSGSFKVAIPAASVPELEGYVIIEATATDSMRKQTVRSTSVSIDKKPPTVLVTSPMTRFPDSSMHSAYIDIKGEVFDRSPIASVKVRLLMENGTVLAGPQEADGTNTWTTRFMLKDAILSGKPDGAYFFDVAVTDVAGNRSYYYFHRSDIVKVKNAQASFPSMDELGRLDQDGVVGHSGVSLEALRASRLGPSLGRLADFTFEAEPQIAIEFAHLNSPRTVDENVLAPRSKITGAILPPSTAGPIDKGTITAEVYVYDGPLLLTMTNTADDDTDGIKVTIVGNAANFAIDLKNGPSDLDPGKYAIRLTASAESITKSSNLIPFTVDAAAPVFSETTISPTELFRRAPFRFSFNGAHSTQLDRIEIRQSFNGSPYELVQTIPLSTSNISGVESDPMPATVQGDGLYNYDISLFTVGGKATTLMRSITYDQTSPTLAVTDVSPVSGANLINGVVNLAVSASDANGIQSLRRWILPAAEAEPSWNTPGYVEWPGPPYATTIDTTQLSAGPVRLWVRVLDRAGNESAVQGSYVVDQDSDRPFLGRLNLNAAYDTPEEAAGNLLESGAKVSGTVSDDDGVNIGSVRISVDGAASVLAGTRTAQGTGCLFEHDLSSLGEGVHTITLSFSDINGVAGTPVTIYFVIDRTDPVVTINSPASGSFHRGDFTITGTASDGTALHPSSPLRAVVRKGNGEPEPVTLSGNAAAWTIAANGLDEGTYLYTITATDQFGKTGFASLSAVVDKTPPTLSIVSPSAGSWHRGATLSASGTASDGSGVVRVEVSADSSDGQDGTWIPATGTATWSALVAVDSLGEGNGKRLYVRALDIAGNSGTATVFYGIDQSDPSSTIVAPESAGAAFAISGVAGDSNGLSSIRIVQRKNGDPASDEALMIEGLSGTSQAWSSGAVLPIGGVSTGGYEYSITVRDIAGNTRTYTHTVTIDLDKPESVILDPAPSALLFGSSYRIRGTASDVGSGVSRVEYSVPGKIDWTAAEGTGAWSATLDLSTVGEGPRSLYARAYDRAGNVQESPTTVTFIVDQAPPTLSESSSGLGSAIAFSRTAVTLGGDASDANGIKHVVVSYDKDGASVEALRDVTDDGSWAWILSAPSDHTGDGLYDIAVTATDGADRQTIVYRKIHIDTRGPTLTVEAPLPGSSSAIRSYMIAGTANESGGSGFDGIADVEYSLDEGTTWISMGLAAGSWSAEVDLGVTQGSKTLGVRSSDRLGNVTESTIPFFYDTEPPELSETAVGTTDTRHINVNLGFSGQASDSNALHGSEALSVSVNGEPPVDVPVGVGGAWSYTLDVDTDGPGADTGLANGLYLLDFTAKDAAGKTTTLRRSVRVDTVAPQLDSVSDLAGAWRLSESNALVVSASDVGGGVASVAYRLDGGAWNQLSYQNPNWIGTAAIPAGTHSLSFRATDLAGNYSDSPLQTVRVDTEAPAANVSSPTGLVKLRDGSSLSLSVNASDSHSGVKSVAVRLGSSDFTNPATITWAALGAGNTASGTWNASLSISKASDPTEGQKTVFVRVTDEAGRHSTASFTVLVDYTPPTVAISSHEDGAVVNGAIVLAGSASDTQGLQSVVIAAYNAASGLWEPLVSTGTFSWTVALNTLSYSTSHYDSDPVAPGVQLRLRVRASDEAQNQTDFERVVTIDQASDIPIIRFTNIKASETSLLKMTTTVYGSVVDDDGVSAIEASLDGSTWHSLALSAGNWSFDVSQAIADPAAREGDKSLHLRVRDGASPGWFYDNLRIELSAGNYKPQAGSPPSVWPVAFKVDTIAPEINGSIYIDSRTPASFATPVEMSGNMPVGGASQSFALRVLARDANGIKSDGVSVTVSGVTYTAAKTGSSGGFEVFQTAPIPCDGTAMSDGLKTVAIQVADNSGLTAQASRTVFVDNTPPTLSFLTPASAAIVNGELIVKGTASDSGSGLASVSYRLGLDYVDDSPQNVSGSIFLWEVPFTGVNRLETYLSPDEALLDTYTGVSLYLLPVVVRASDASGNAIESAPISGSGASRPSTTRLLSTALRNNSMLARGQAIVIGNDVRILTDYIPATGELSWSGPVDLSQTSFTIYPYSLRIDPDGDKPRAAISYPDTGATLGGSIRVYGTALDDDGVAEVFMQIDTNGDGLYDPADDAIGGWFAGGNGKSVSGSSNWYQAINSAGEFNPSGAATKIINVRVRAVDIYGVVGPWTPAVELRIDNDVPQLGSAQPFHIDPDGIADNGDELPYEFGMHVRGSFTLRGSIEDETAIKSIAVSGAGPFIRSISFSGGAYSGDTGSFELKSPAVAADGSYKRIDLALRVECPPNASLTWNFTVTALDVSAPARESSLAMRLHADTQAPTVALDAEATPATVQNSDGWYKVRGTAQDIGSDIDRVEVFFIRRGATAAQDRLYYPGASNRHAPLSSLSLTSGTPVMTGNADIRGDTWLVDDALAGNDAIAKGQTIIIGGYRRMVSAYDRPSGRVDWSGGTVDTSLAAYTLRLALQVDHKNSSEGWNAAGTAINGDDGDGFVEYLRQNQGTTYTWFVDLDSHNIPDGPIEIHYVAFDSSGNMSAGSTNGYKVQNNAPRIASIWLGSDLDRNGTISANERAQYAYASPSTDGLSVTTAFRIKETPVSILPVVTQGNGDLFAYLRLGETEATLSPVDADPGTDGLQPFRIRHAGSDEPIVLASLGLPDGPIVFELVVWDSTEETTPGVSSLSLMRVATATLDLVDEVTPKVVIDPLVAGPGPSGSLYEGLAANGHVETAALTGAAAALADADPKVSGRIVIRGSAYDDQRLERLWLNVDGFGFSGAAATKAQFDTDGNGTPETLASSYHQVASYSGGSWTALDRWDAQGWKVSVTDDYLDQRGHRVLWTLSWDSSRLAGVAATDVTIRAMAEDKRTAPQANASSETASSTADPTTINRPSLRVDVVPYIKAVTRNPTYNTHRSRAGAVSLLRGEAGNGISGFNLGTAGTASLSLSSDKAGTAITTAITSYSVQSSTAATFTLPASAKDGYLSIVVNGVRSINNLNDNRLDYNKEALANRPETDYWNDDRLVRAWQSDAADFFAGSDNPVYPSMGMDSGGALYASFSNYSTARVYYSGIGGTAQSVFYTYDPSEETAISVVGAGATRRVNVLYSANYHGGNTTDWVRNADQAGGLYLYDYQAPSINVGRDNQRTYRFELFYHNKMLQQFKNLRVVRTSAASNARIHISYYDRITNAIKYSNVQSGFNPSSASEHELSWVKLDGGADADDTAAYTDGSSIALGAARFTDGLQVSSGTGEMSAISLTSTGLPVVVYYDADRNVLKLARANSANPKGNENLWTVQPVLAAGDANAGTVVDYIAAKIDSSNYLHIAFQNSRGELVYLRSTNNPSDGTTRYTFGSSQVLASSAMWTDLTLRGTTPYISYLSRINSFDGVHITYYDASLDLDGDGVAEGGWETMTAAMNYKASNVRTSIAAHPDPSAGGWTAAVGFTPGNLYRVVRYIGF